MKRAITYGTFDMFHIGHLKLLERIKQDCDHLTVAVSTDEFNAVNGKTTVIPYEDRAAIVASLKLVDRVIPENDWEQKTPDIINNNIDIFVIGSDWTGKFDFLQSHCRVAYLERTPGISSTQLKKTLGVQMSDLKSSLFSKIEELQKIIDDLPE
jgi:glycerol-3-phosphate cytidylyltransferase